MILAAALILTDLWLLGRMTVLNEYSGYLSLGFQEETVTEASFIHLLESENKELFLSAAVWKMEGESRISSVLTGKKQVAACYSMKGQPEAVFGRTLLSGRYFLNGEKSLCLIDQQSAWELFGTYNAMGNKIQIDQKTYQVAGVLSGQNPICIIPAAKGSTFDAITVEMKASGQSVQNLIRTLEIYAGSTAERVIDGQFYTGLSRIGCSLNLAAFFFMLYMIFTQRRIAKSGIIKWIFKVMGLMVVLIILNVGIQHSGLSRDYLPTYWSDFKFYSGLWKEKTEAIRQLVSHQEFWHEQQLLISFCQVMTGCSILSAGQFLKGMSSKVHGCRQIKN